MSRPPSDARDRILESAVQLLRTEGIKGFSQPRVAKASGVPQGHITYYFPKKSDLLHAVAARFSEDIARIAKALAAAGPGAIDKSFPLIGRWARDRERTRTLLGLVIESQGDEVLRTALIGNTTNLLGVLADLLALPRGSVEAELAHCTLWGVGLMHLLRAGKAGDDRTLALLAALHGQLAGRPPPKANGKSSRRARHA